MKKQDVTASLQAALSSLPAKPSAENTAELRARVDAFIDAAKAQGWPVERVIVALKQLAADAGLRSSVDVLRVGGSLQHRDEVLLDLVRWSVERYFDYTRPPRTPGRKSEPGSDPRDRH